MSADQTTERLSRWMAARSTRRSFLDRLARVAVLVAGGPTLLTLLARSAEARVCGQSGVSLKCPTFDCVGPGRVWGWCWYASPGCCAGGGLKKICDCCTFRFPNVHGYCPAGYNVECIVESCFADPRVQTAATTRLFTGDSISTAAAVSAARFPRGQQVAVLGDGEDTLFAALAATVAGALGAPLLLSHRSRLSSAAIVELQRLGVGRVVMVGPGLGPAVAQRLTHYGLTVERLGTGTAHASLSLELARWIVGRGRGRRAFAVGTDPVSVAATPGVASVAAAARRPLVIGFDAARELSQGPGAPVLTYLVGPSMAPRAGEIPGGHPLSSPTPDALSRQVANVGVVAEGVRGTVALVPRGQVGVATGLAHAGGVVVYHSPGVVDGATGAWLRAHQPALTRGFVAGTLGALGTRGYYDVQSALNHFDTHRLVGVAGQGLPVISQPLPERDIGRARLAGVPEERMGGYWVARANPDRS